MLKMSLKLLFVALLKCQKFINIYKNIYKALRAFQLGDKGMVIIKTSTER